MEPEEAGEPRTVSRCDVSDDLRERSLLAGGDVEIADGQKTGGRQESIDSVQEGVVVGHHAASTLDQYMAFARFGIRE